MAEGHCSCRDHGFCKPGFGKHEHCTPDRCELCAPGKHPITPHGHVDASADPAKVRAWWANTPLANIAIRPAPDVLVVDVDPRNSGHKTLAALEAKHGPFPNTMTVRTGGGGLHAYFRVPEGLSWPKNLDKLGCGQGVDLKTNTGYLVAPPSNHESGGVYKWVSAPDAPIAPAPSWLVQIGRERSAAPLKVFDEDEGALRMDNEIADAVARIAPLFVRGKKHDIAYALGGWLRNSCGWNSADVARVVEQLPSKAPRARVQDALDGYKASQGWHALRALVGDAAAADLEANIANPLRTQKAEDEKCANEILAPALASAAVVINRDSLHICQVTPLQGVPIRDQRLALLGRIADLSKPPEPLVYICRGLGIAPGKITGLSGYPGTGKGPFLALLALCLASGMSFLGMPVMRSRVVLWDLETGRLAETRLHRLANAIGVDVPRLMADGWLVLIHGEPPIAMAHIEQVRGLAAERSLDVVLFDSYTSGVPGDANVQDHAKVAWELGAISNAHGVTIIGTTHEKKRQERKRGGSDLEMQAGSFALSAAQQTTVTLARPDDKDRNLIEVRCARAPEEGFAPFKFRWEDVPDPGDAGGIGGYLTGSREWGLRAAIVSGADTGPTTDDKARKRQERVAALKPLILEWLTKTDQQKLGQTTIEIRKGLGVTQEDVGAACLELLAERKLEQSKVGREKPYHLPHATPYAPPTAGYAPPPLAAVPALPPGVPT